MNRLSALLLLTLTLLLALIGLQLERPVPAAGFAIAEPDSKTASGTMDATAFSLSVPPLASLSETTRRPLFVESRRAGEEATAVSEAAPVAVSARPSFSLSAIIITGDQRAVLVRDPATGSLIRLRQGEALAGWTLDQVSPDQAVFSKEGESQSAILRRFDQSPVGTTAAGAGGAVQGLLPPGAEAGGLRRPTRRQSARSLLRPAQ